jgi:hypothetical protein
MNETEWFGAADPIPMLRAVQTQPRKRAVRLFSCACCRRLWPLLSPASRASVGAAERFADGLCPRAELDAAHAAANAAVLALPNVWPFEVLRQRYAATAASECSSVTAGATKGAIAIATTAALAAAIDAAVRGDESDFSRTRDAALAAEQLAQADLVLEIFGNPFRPAAFAPAWRTDTAVLLARQAYEANEFSALPILADALQDAGCDRDDLLSHLRDPGRGHVRGCWAVDLVLGLTKPDEPSHPAPHPPQEDS